MELRLNKDIQLVLCVAGIYVFYIIFGMLQEQITVEEFGPNDERFKFTGFLLLVQSVVNCLCAFIILKIFNFPRDKTKFHHYGLVSATSIAAHFCSSKAIMFVDYPTQVLAKSCKPIPVMLMGLIAFKKRYTTAKYLVVLIITVGIALFMLNPPLSHKHPHSQIHPESKKEPAVAVPLSLAGLGLLALSLSLDGITGPFQDELVRKYNPSSTHLMFYSTVWQSLLMGVVVLFTGELFPAIDFCRRFPEINLHILLYSLCSACGQIFIYQTVHQFGSLLCTIVTTSRKFFTILVSVVWFDHTLTPLHWVSVGLVFFGLSCDIFMAKQHVVVGILNKLLGRAKKGE